MPGSSRWAWRHAEAVAALILATRHEWPATPCDRLSW